MRSSDAKLYSPKNLNITVKSGELTRPGEPVPFETDDYSSLLKSYNVVSNAIGGDKTGLPNPMASTSSLRGIG